MRGLDGDLLESYEGYDVAGVNDEDLKDDPWLRWGDAHKRELARRKLVDELRQWQYSVQLDGADVTGELSRPAEDLSQIVDQISQGAPWISAPYRHINMLLQRDDNAGVFILNDSFGGVGFPVSRFSHVIAESSHEMTADIEAVAGEAGVRLVEISGGTVFSNLNLHEPILTTRLKVPGDPVRPSQDSIAGIDYGEASLIRGYRGHSPTSAQIKRTSQSRRAG